jgi:hypothetical protein
MQTTRCCFCGGPFGLIVYRWGTSVFAPITDEPDASRNIVRLASMPAKSCGTNCAMRNKPQVVGQFPPHRSRNPIWFTASRTAVYRVFLRRDGDRVLHTKPRLGDCMPSIG